jgi:hypothetical protein
LDAFNQTEVEAAATNAHEERLMKKKTSLDSQDGSGVVISSSAKLDRIRRGLKRISHSDEAHDD